MNEQNIDLTPAEWSVMECLWERSPLTGREVTELMHERCGWSRSTTLTLLSRMEAKGTVAVNSDIGKKSFHPLVCREDAALQETEDFLGRVYKGSLSLLVNSLTRKQPLSQKEIDELYAILKEMEANQDA
jgi:BlaI family penicillinase repressor